MKGLISLILILFAVGCLPEQKVGQRTIGDGSVTGETPSPTQPNSTSDVELAWYQSLTSTSVLSLFRDANDNVYIRGRRIENFLLKQNAPTATYCIEIDMGPSVPALDRRFLRLRAVPLTVNNISAGNKTIYLRVDFGNTAAGQTVCNRDKVQYINDTSTQFIPFAAVSSSVSFTLPLTCQNCVTQILSSNIKLFQVVSNSTSMSQVRPSDLDLGLLTLSLQPGNAPNLSGSCSTSSCAAIGFNCCLDNQCVNDGSVRPGVNQSSAAYLAAEQAKLNNPLAFLNYPQFYFICGTTQPQPPINGGGSQTDADAAAAARLLEMQKDYACIQHLKTKTTATPFNLQPFVSTETYNQSLCNTTSTTNAYYWETVLNRLYVNCGCDAANTNLAMRLANCPKYDYRVVAQDALGAPIQFSCFAFDESGVDSPFQNLEISVSSRAVPHRFFNQSGNEVDPSKNPPTTTTQEGEAFSYLDPEKIQPVNGTYNMNAILGAININLTDALPAKVIDVELDNVYLIATRSGFYTPCPTCAQDSWFPSFRPHPSSSQGVGLQAVGHSTSRDLWDNNSTLGNYEDTIFGRACWVPPTMLPFSQPLSSSSPEAQRRTRLETQAAMYANGYQRDWYGFNKGALIGSFDGVSWFAIGKGRIVRSTTKKLFLAINAPFGDLAEDNNHFVSVQAYEGQATAAVMDFDPSLVQNHPNQNEAGNCQAYHRCNVDTDCISRLGWEYVCADITSSRTYWPTFEPVDAKERRRESNEEPRTIESILAQGVLPSGSTKRCVYRGAGAVCRTDSGGLAAADIEKRKLLTCAPNFWCADVDSTNSNIPNTSTFLNVFNKEVARFARPLDEVPVTNNHLYGRDSNFLGRPLDYVHNKNDTPTNSLTQISSDRIRRTIDANVTAMDPQALGKVGLCRPGKRLPTSANIGSQWNPFNQHQGLDEFSRTDYINQISSCPSNYLSINKLASCPVIGDDGNYLHQSASFASFTNSAQWSRRSVEQNSCGLESLRNGTLTNNATADTLQNNSPFKLIEGKPLNASLNVTPTLVRDACLRRPGSVCHTDLDCSPNKFHAEQIQFFDVSYFGNTPNQEFYEQYLVCGQETPKPLFNSSAFDSYDMTKNVCCREVGKDITTYSAQEPNGTNSVDPLTANLNPLATGISEPTNIGRYERFAVVRGLGTSFPVLSANSTRSATTGALSTAVYSGSLSTVNVAGSVVVSNQWKTLNQANSKTCCGGGWIRKFDDGTTDWSKKDRFRLDVSNFRCLNYYTPLAATTTPSIWGLFQSQIDIDYSKYCSDISGATGNCAQVTIPQGSITTTSCAASEYENPALNPYANILKNDITTIDGISTFSYTNNNFSFFRPITADGDPNTFVDYDDDDGRRNIRIFVPSYVGDTILEVKVHRIGQGSTGGADERLCALEATGVTNITNPTDPGTCTAGAGNCCYEYDSVRRIMKIAIIPGAPGVFNNPGATNESRYGAKITYRPPGAGDVTKPLAKPACSDVHYLDILGKLELAGIPQITHKKIVCNNNAEKLVPGIFKITEGDSNRENFNRASFAFSLADTGGNYVDDSWQTNHHGLENGPVFSSHDFKCCTPAGKVTTSADLCCTGYAAEPSDESLPPGTLKCLLPTGANLSVYLNRFVSNEGIGSHLISSPMVESDFNQLTGEPILTTTVNAKVSAIGSEICESGQTRRGGVFGEFIPEPTSPDSQGNLVYGIVDSSTDVATNSSGGGTSETGYFAYLQGFRWNHHYYCQ
jgi:hypothetical protein